MGITTNFFGVYKGEMFSTEPAPGFDPEKPWADPVAGFEQREYVVREKMVEVAKCQVNIDKLLLTYWSAILLKLEILLLPEIQIIFMG
jgi:hypothetical protein